MNRRDFLKSGLTVSAGLAIGIPGLKDVAFANDARWRTFEVTTRLEVADPVGAVRAWAEALRRFGTYSWSQALEPGVALARSGLPVSARLSADIAEAAEKVRADTTAARIYLPEGAVPPVGSVLQQSDLGVNPTNDGKLIRIVFPPLTEERRKELVKVVKNMAEEGRVAVRNIRRHTKADMEALQGEISEDDIRRGEEELQKLTDRFTERIDSLLANKEEELLEV